MPVTGSITIFFSEGKRVPIWAEAGWAGRDAKRADRSGNNSFDFMGYGVKGSRWDVVTGACGRDRFKAWQGVDARHHENVSSSGRKNAGVGCSVQSSMPHRFGLVERIAPTAVRWGESCPAKCVEGNARPFLQRSSPGRIAVRLCTNDLSLGRNHAEGNNHRWTQMNTDKDFAGRRSHAAAKIIRFSRS